MGETEIPLLKLKGRATKNESDRGEGNSEAEKKKYLDCLLHDSFNFFGVCETAHYRIASSLLVVKSGVYGQILFFKVTRDDR
jgi:hypothetical protein